MPICTRDGFEAKAQKTLEKFQDNEMVFYCETTKEIFRDYEEYFRHVMLINSTIWQCEITGRENLTYAEALYSEKKARKKIDSFKDCLRAPTLLVINKSPQATYKDIFNLVHNFLRDRFFMGEIVQAVITSAASYHECKIIEIIKPTTTPTATSANSQLQQQPVTNVYDPAVIKYKLQKLSGVQNGEHFIVPTQNIKRNRLEFGRDILQLFIKDSVYRLQGLIKPKPEVFKKYVTDKNIEWQTIFIGDLPTWTPPKPRLTAPKKDLLSKNKKDVGNKASTNVNKKDTANGNKKIIANGNKKIAKQSSISNFVKDINPTEKLKQEKSLQEEMERIRKEKEAKAVEIERKRLERLEKINNEIKRIIKKTDDLERYDQKLLPVFRPIKTIFPIKYFGDFVYIQEFLHTFAGILSGIDDRFNRNITFYEMARAFTTNEVAGPFSDILTVLLSTIFDLQMEEEEECSTEYIKPRIGVTAEPWPTIRSATLCHIYVRKHLSNKLHDLPIDPQTISEVLRLHLLASGANTDEKSDRWRYTYRNGYFITEDPGLLLRIQQPHILRALRMYTIYQLPFSDKLKILNCLIAQILSYSSTINVVDERKENVNKSKQKIREILKAENKRVNSLVIEKKRLQQAYQLKILTPDIKDNVEKKKELDDNIQKQIELIDMKNLKEKKSFESEMLKEQSKIFNFMTYFGMDRSYRKYYAFESLPGLFIEHTDESYDSVCLENPPKNWQNLIYIPKTRKDLHTFFEKYFHDLENSPKNNSKSTRNSENDIEADKENLENLPNGKISTTISDIKPIETTLLNGISNGDIKPIETTLLNGSNSASTTDIVESNDIKQIVSAPTSNQLYMCSGIPSECIVHNSKHPNRIKWSYIYLESEFDELVNSLNPFGERESHLREELITYKPLLVNHMKNCPINYLFWEDNAKRLRNFELQMNTETNRRYTNPNYGLPHNSDINDIMYSSCVEKILQLEVDITTGCLGKMKVNDLQKWRQNLLDNQYDAQVELVYGLDEKAIDPGENLGNTLEIESEDSSDEGVISYDSPELKKNVEHLASALLQIEQSIEQKFFKAPFGLQNEIRDKGERQQRLAKATLKLKYWEISLMKSNSFSSIFLHLNILYDTIKWNRSTNRSCCIICRRRGEPEKMLLCDECNAGTHMFCLKPKLKKIPEGDWYCKRCVSLCGYSNNVEEEIKSKRRRFMPKDDFEIESRSSSKCEDSDEYLPREVMAQRKRDQKLKIKIDNHRRYVNGKNGTEDDEEEENENGDDGISEGELEFENDDAEEEEGHDDNDDDEEQEQKQTEEKIVDNNNSEVEEDDSYAETDEDETEETAEENDEDEGVCNICSYNGCEITCGSCEAEFHLDCIKLKRAPRSTWKCPKCKNKEEKKRKSYDSSEDSEEDPAAKRAKRNTSTSSKQNTTATLRNSRSSTAQIDDGPKYNNNNRRSRRTGDNLPLNSVLLYDLLDEISKNDFSWPFLRPVLQSEVPDYYDIIKRPMDFAKIKSKLNMGQYRINEELLNDIQLVFKNCDTYNSEGNEIYIAGASLEKFVIKRCKEFNLPFTPSDMNAS